MQVSKACAKLPAGIIAAPGLKIVARTGCLVSLFTLCACSMLSSVPIPGLDYIAGEEGLLRDRKADYLEAEVLPRTTIPSEYDSYIIDDLMVIPQVPGNNTQAFLDAPRPRAFSGRSERGVVIQRMSGDSWVVVDVSPSEVWPRIRDYWTSKSIGVAFENPTRGVLDTGWFVLAGNSLTKEKIRVTVEPGFQNDSAEIRLLHLAVGQSIPVLDQVNWPESSTDPEVEYDFLTDLSNYLVDVADLYQASTVSFLAENIDGRGKANILSTPGGKDILHLEAGFDRSWAAIDRALRRAEIEIIADSIDQGVFEVNYVIPTETDEEEPGLFSKIFTLNGVFNKDEPQEYFPLQIQVLDLDGEVEVIIESINATQQRSDSVIEAENSLLRLLRNNIA